MREACSQSENVCFGKVSSFWQGRVGTRKELKTPEKEEVRIEGGGKELGWPEDTQLPHLVHFPTSLVTWSARPRPAVPAGAPCALAVASCCLGKQSWQEMVLEWIWASRGWGDHRSSQSLRAQPGFCLLGFGQAWWLARGQCDWGEAHSSLRMRSPSTRENKNEQPTIRKEIQFVGCSQLCLLHKFFSSCHFYKNTWKGWVEARGRRSWLMVSFTDFRNPRSSCRGRHLCAPSSVSGPDGGCGGGFSALTFAPKENGILASPRPCSAWDSKMYSNQVLAGSGEGMVGFPHCSLAWLDHLQLSFSDL